MFEEFSPRDQAKSVKKAPKKTTKKRKLPEHPDLWRIEEKLKKETNLNTKIPTEERKILKDSGKYNEGKYIVDLGVPPCEVLFWGWKKNLKEAKIQPETTWG